MKILIICTGNTCRSPMAAEILKKMAKERNLDIEVDSAGIFAFEDQSASDNAISVLRREGIELQSHKAKRLDKRLITEADLIITMTESHRDAILKFMPATESKTYTLNGFIEKPGDILDPFGCSVEVYRQTLDEIKDSLSILLDKIEEK